MREFEEQLEETRALPVAQDGRTVPALLLGHETPRQRESLERFYLSVPKLFEAWLARRSSENTRRAYRRDVMDFIEFRGIAWPAPDGTGPDTSYQLFEVTVPEVQAWRDFLQHERDAAPNTLNRRISSLSGLYSFLREVAAEARLPISVPNPVHSQFIGREAQGAVTPTEALSAARARQLVALPAGEEVRSYRDRAILKFYLYLGTRIGTGCRLQVADFLPDDEDPKVRIQEKGRGKAKRVVGIHVLAADAIAEYLAAAALTKGPLFRPRKAPRSKELAARPMDVSTMYRLLQSYLEQLPGAMQDIELADGSTARRCLYSPHSLRATTATLLLDAGEDIRDVQKLLGHKHVTVTQVYDKRRRGTKDSASHRLSI